MRKPRSPKLDYYPPDHLLQAARYILKYRTDREFGRFLSMVLTSAAQRGNVEADRLFGLLSPIPDVISFEWAKDQFGDKRYSDPIAQYYFYLICRPSYIYSKLVGSEFPPTMCLLGSFLLMQNYNDKQGWDLLDKAKRLGEPDALYELSRFRKDIEFPLLCEAVKYGHLEAMNRLCVNPVCDQKIEKYHEVVLAVRFSVLTGNCFCDDNRILYQAVRRFRKRTLRPADLMFLYRVGREVQENQLPWPQAEYMNQTNDAVCVYLTVSHAARRAALQTLRLSGLHKDVAMMIATRYIYGSRNSEPGTWWRR